MPYIHPKLRNEARVVNANEQGVDTPGELAFLIADVIDNYLLRLNRRGGYHYADLADIDGVLGTAQHEFRRRILDPYEDLARAINGEVYTVLEDDDDQPQQPDDWVPAGWAEEAYLEDCVCRYCRRVRAQRG